MSTIFLNLTNNWNHKKISINNHPYHIVDPSWSPIVVALNLLLVPLFLVCNIHGYFSNIPFFISLIFLIFNLITWFKQVWIESTVGHHTIKVRKGLWMGFKFFLLTEAAFFFSIFWTFFSAALIPTIEIGCVWPPYGLYTYIPNKFYSIPTLNLVLLLTSETWVYCARQFLARGNYVLFLYTISATVIFGVWFVLIQAFEFTNALYSINDSIYGSILYFGTGFHGLHIICGSIFLAYEALKVKYRYKYISTNRIVAMKCFYYYWHFVDAVWVFLWSFVYMWTIL